MAERRMFSKAIVNSARFLRMPQTSRLLYYDLGMAADDDGVVEAFAVIRTTGAAEDDLRVLASKGFVIVLNEDLVSFITDWTENNRIRQDRYKPSIYAKLLVKLADGDKATADCQPSDNHVTTNCQPNGNQVTTNRQPSDNQMATQYRLGKDRLGKGSVEGKPPVGGKRSPRFSPPSVEEVRAYCRERGNRVDPERFVDFYASKGWKVGKNPMADWKACVRTWERRDRDNGNGGGNGTPFEYDPGDMTGSL